MDYLSRIKKPIESDLDDFNGMFDDAMSHPDGLLSQALAHIRRRAGKRMRPMLIMLMARNYGRVTAVTQNAALGLELLHTASLVHDDVVDESGERRGQASVNATYNNQVAVLVGDYLLSTALLRVACTQNITIVEYLSELGRTLASGEILQLSNIQNQEISEDVYYQVIKQKQQPCSRLVVPWVRYRPVLVATRLRRQRLSVATLALSSRFVTISSTIMIRPR